MLLPNIYIANVAQKTFKSIGGTVVYDGTAIKKRIHIYHRGTGAYIAGTYSDSQGRWFIHGVDVLPLQIVAVAYDDTAKYNAQVVDFVSLI